MITRFEPLFRCWKLNSWSLLVLLGGAVAELFVNRSLRTGITYGLACYFGVIFTTAMITLDQRVAAAMLRYGYCPGCSYELAGLTAQEDGCVICPECGAAWRLPRAA